MEKISKAFKIANVWIFIEDFVVIIINVYAYIHILKETSVIY